MGVTNELFMNERPSPDEELASGLPAGCKFNPTPEDKTNVQLSSVDIPSDTVQFAMFMRLLAPPLTSTSGIPGKPGAQSIANGKQDFVNIGCSLCHTPVMTTGSSNIAPALNKVSANLYSDLLVHGMGTNLAGLASRRAAPGRTSSAPAPLWGLGQRIFFLHDGRTTDLLDAIKEHSSSGSEAKGVIGNFNKLTASQQQDLLNFLRSL